MGLARIGAFTAPTGLASPLQSAKVRTVLGPVAKKPWSQNILSTGQFDLHVRCPFRQAKPFEAAAGVYFSPRRHITMARHIT